jgi:hypothetical protein
MSNPPDSSPAIPEASSRTPAAWTNESAPLWYVGVTVAVCGALVGLLRLVDVLWVGHYHKVLVPLAMFVAVLLIASRKRLRLDLLGLCLLLAVPWGIVVGLGSGGAARPFISHLGAGAFAFLVYSASRLALPDPEWLRRLWRVASYSILIAYALSIAAFWTISMVTGETLYLGIGTGDVLFAMSYFLVYERRWLAALCVTVVILSGKRGTLLAMLITLLYALRVSWLRGFYRRSLFACVMAVGFVFLSLYFRDSITSVGWPSAITRVLEKWYQVDPFQEEFDIDVAFSGRNQEIALAFGKLADRPHQLLTGMGYGWSYFFDARIAGSDTTDFVSHYVHLSPANFVLLYGAPFALLLTGLLVVVMARGYLTRDRDNAHLMRKVLALYCIGTFVSSLSGYTYATDPLFWTALGTLSATGLWRQELQLT